MSVKLNQEAGDYAFIKTVQSFSDHLIVRLQNQPTDEDTMQFILTELQLVTHTYQKKKGVNVS
jgi:hypothetical protein